MMEQEGRMTLHGKKGRGTLMPANRNLSGTVGPAIQHPGPWGVEEMNTSMREGVPV
jgi:hypothetical protein